MIQSLCRRLWQRGKVAGAGIGQFVVMLCVFLGCASQVRAEGASTLAEQAHQARVELNTLRKARAQARTAWEHESEQLHLLLDSLHARIKRLQSDAEANTTALKKLSTTLATASQSSGNAAAVQQTALALAELIHERLDAMQGYLIPGTVPDRGAAVGSAEAQWHGARARWQETKARMGRLHMDWHVGRVNGAVRKAKVLSYGGVFGWWYDGTQQEGGMVFMTDGAISFVSTSDPGVIHKAMTAHELGSPRVWHWLPLPSTLRGSAQ